MHRSTSHTARIPRHLRRLVLACAVLALTSAAIILPMAGRAVEPAPVSQAIGDATAPVSGLTAAQVAAASVAAASVPVAVSTAGGTVDPVAVIALPLVLADAAPIAVEPPRDDPAAIPHSDVLLPATIVNNLLAPPPLPAQEANAAADAIRETQEAPGRGITQQMTPLANGITLFAPQRSTLVVTLLPGASAITGAGPTLLPAARTVPAAAGATTDAASAPAASVNFIAPNRAVVSGAACCGTQTAATVAAAPVATTAYPVASLNTVSLNTVSSSAPLATQAGAQVYTLVDHACVDFNAGDEWASRRVAQPSDIWTDWFAGWAPFAVDEGYYQAQNVTFSLERVVGPGSNYGPNEHSAKIASSQPYAAGLGSPLLHVRPGATVIVSANYLIFDHDSDGGDDDWASLGIKPDAWADGASYVNGLTRGRWDLMTHSVVAGRSGQIMVLLQAHSPAALNSNIYFDNVRIWVDGLALEDCRYE